MLSYVINNSFSTMRHQVIQDNQSLKHGREKKSVSGLQNINVIIINVFTYFPKNKQCLNISGARTISYLVNVTPIFTSVADPLPHNVHDHLVLVTANGHANHISTSKTGFCSTSSQSGNRGK